MLALERVVDSLEKVCYVDGAGSLKVSVCNYTALKSDSSNLCLSLACNVVLKSRALNVPSACGHCAVVVAKSNLGYGSSCVKCAVLTVLCGVVYAVESAKNDLAICIGNDGGNCLCNLGLCKVLCNCNADSELVVLSLCASAACKSGNDECKHDYDRK